MALEQVKIEMKGTTSRWTRRSDAKYSSKKRRRENNKRIIRDAKRDVP